MTNVRAKLISNQWILVEWNRLTNDQCNGPNLRYLLSINNDTVINTTTNIQLVNINASQQCEQISLAVAAINDYGNGPISNQIKIVASDGGMIIHGWYGVTTQCYSNNQKIEPVVSICYQFNTLQYQLGMD